MKSCFSILLLSLTIGFSGTCQISPENFVKTWIKAYSNFPSEINTDEQFLLQYYSEKLSFVIDTTIGSYESIEKEFINDLEFYKLYKSDWGRTINIDKTHTIQKFDNYSIIICDISIKYNENILNKTVNNIKKKSLTYRCSISLKLYNTTWKIVQFHYTIMPKKVKEQEDGQG